MTEPAQTLVAIGGLMLLGLLTDLLGRHSPLPRVTLLLVLGTLIGPGALDLLPAHGADWFPVVADMALVMVAFLLGGQLTRATLREHGRRVLCLSASLVAATTLLVVLGLLAVGAPLGLALLPQAGVALGMALVAAERFPELADRILPVVIASTVLFEVLGPVATRRALRRAGEAQA